MNYLKDTLGKNKYGKISKESQPDFFSPMLATLTHDYFNHKDWVYERKLDGERAVTFVKNKEVRLMSRNQKKINFRYPEIVDYFKGINFNFVIDGEIVALANKLSSFEKLQDRMHVSSEKEAKKSKVRIFYYIFDIIHCQGFNLSKLDLTSRKKILKDLFNFKKPIRYLIHRRENGLKYYKQACKKGWEGIIAKDGNSNYVYSRSKKWLKFKCIKQQEFVIGGYTDPKGSRTGFGALLLGYYKDKDLKYAGEVGTGFDHSTLEFLKPKLKKLEIDEPPFSETENIENKGVHWVKPQLVCEVGFTEWTRYGKLRHPRYKGLRNDKQPEKVAREE
ncbi:MAG: non-homologous end-joining DNA ligase [Candidatus Humimicrobiaceae bacterium]